MSRCPDPSGGQELSQEGKGVLTVLDLAHSFI